MSYSNNVEHADTKRVIHFGENPWLNRGYSQRERQRGRKEEIVAGINATVARSSIVINMEDKPKLSNVESLKQRFEAILHEIDQLETETEKSEALAAIKSCLDPFQKSSKPSILNFPEKHKPDLSSVPLWRGKIKDGAALEWLGKQYGQWLERFGAERNVVFRQDILNHDPKLVKSIDQEAHRQQIKSREFLPTRSDKVDEIAENIPPHLTRLASTLQRRQYKR